MSHFHEAGFCQKLKIGKIGSRRKRVRASLVLKGARQKLLSGFFPLRGKRQCATFKSIHKRIHPLLENYLKDQIGKTDHDDPNMRAVHVCSGEWENYSDVDHQLSKFGI